MSGVLRSRYNGCAPGQPRCFIGAHPVHLISTSSCDMSLVGNGETTMNGSNIIDIEQLKKSPAVPTRRRPPVRTKRFLKGPIPWGWLAAACSLPGKALHVGIALWLWAGIEKSSQVRLGTSRLAQVGASRHSAYRALNALESAGLVTVARRKGKSPLVTILEASV
jgi:hypothetical protein